MTSIEIKVLISLGALGSVYVFVREIQRAQRRRRLIKWVRDHYPREWAGIHWAQRYFYPAAALLILHRSGAITHPHFAREYAIVRRWPRDMIVAFLVACAAIALAGLGGRYFGWSW